MAIKLGINGKLYYDVAGVADDTWTEADNVHGDLTLSMENTEADATTRAGGGWKAVITSLTEASLEFQMIWDTADAGFTAFQNAFLNKSTIGIAAMDAAIATVGSEGLKADMTVTRFARSEPQEGPILVDVTLKPTYSATAPAWYVTPAS